MSLLCKYGCGQEGTHQFKDGTWSCSKSSNSCPTIRKRQSEIIKLSWNNLEVKEKRRRVNKRYRRVLK